MDYHLDNAVLMGM